MHGPVGPALRVLAGPVQRVDDPHPPLRVGQLDGLIVLFGPHPVAGEPIGQQGDQQVVGALVALGTERLALQVGVLELEEHLAGPVGQVGCRRVVLIGEPAGC